MAQPTRMSNDSHSTTAASGGWSTRKIAVTAFFCALSFVLTYVEIPIFPPAAWLEYDPSGIVCFVAALAYGPAMGTLVTVITWLMRLVFTFNPYGDLMAILAVVTLIVPASMIYRPNPSTRSLVLGMVVGAACSLAACIVGNIIVTPLYTAVSTADVVAMIVPILVPFNLMKIAINCVATALVIKPATKLIER